MASQSEDFITRTQGDILIARFKTESLVNAHDIDRIQTRLLAMVDAGSRKVVLDFKNVQFVSSAMLGMMIALSKKLAERHGKLVISHPEHLLELLKVSRTERLFTLADDPKQAIKLF